MRRGKILSVLLTAAMILPLLAGIAPAAAAAANPYEPTQHVTHMGATFGRATAAYNTTQTTGWGENAKTVDIKVEGMPLFNGKEADFPAYIDLLLTEIGDEGIVALSCGSSASGIWTGGTYTIPSGSSTGGEALMGAAGQTELSTVMYQAQSWDKELIRDIGYLIGSENKSKQDNGGYNWTSSTGTSMTDMRLNPLSGRYDEGYGEDSTMASIFADLNARGYNGYEADETGFYIMGSVNTKHYTAYNAQWFRALASTQVGVRSFYEYNAKSANRGWSNGTFSSFMSSYGRINGVPSSASFITHWAASLSPYAVGTGTDAGADSPYLSSVGNPNGQGIDYTYGEWSNGYDAAYSPDIYYKAAIMAASGHRPSGGTEAVQKALDNGLNGLTVDDLLNAAVSFLTVRTRTGIYDERDANGLSKFYPFNDVAANGGKKVNFESKSSQDVALRNAQEGVVLLKNNNGALPLAKNAKLGVYGPFAKAVNSGIYAVAVNDYAGRGEEAGNNALESIQKRTQDAAFDLGLNQVTIQVGGSYLYVDPADTADGILQLKTAADFQAAADKTGYYFGILDNGQDAVSIYAYGNGRWLRAILSDPTTNFNAWVGSTTPLMNNAFLPESPFGAGWGTADKPLVVADEDAVFKQRPNMGLPPMLSGYPYHFVMEKAGADGEYYIRAGAKVNGVTFVVGVAPMMDNFYGYYLEAQTYTPAEGNKTYTAPYKTLGLGGAVMGGDSSTGAGLKYFAGQSDKTDLTFKVTEVKDYGFSAANAASGDDCAVIFVGQSYLGLSGEGTDRIDLDLGDSQIESALNIAKAYKAAGKKTIAVVYANYPVMVEDLQASKDVDAILFAGYGGQYGGKATAQVLFGEYAPTGRLVSTWYKDLELFPKLDSYSLPQGTLGRTHDTMDGVFTDGFTMDDIDDRITVDMTAADVVGTGLTYKYLTDAQTADHVTYPFGYGLSYSSFAYKNLKVGAQNGTSFSVSLDVTNTGSIKTSEVVQVYMSKTGSAYGNAAAIKSLAGFEKVELAPGETKTVTVPIDLTDVAVWDVNAEKYAVESGAYKLYAAHDSSLSNALSADVNISGNELAKLAIDKENNIWEHSFDAENVHYDEYSKLQTAKSAIADGVGDDIYAVTAKAPGAWTAIPRVDFTGVEWVSITAGAPKGVSGKVELRLDAPDGQKIGEVVVSSTGETTLKLAAKNAGAAQEIHEQGYRRVDGVVSGASGVHDLYLVFTTKDLRVGTIQLSTAFTDVEAGQWYADAVLWADSKNITNGTGNGKFSPTRSCSHAQILTFLYRADRGKGSAETGDMDKAIAWAREKGMIGDSFNKDADCTRADAVNYIWQAFGKKDAKASSFTDVPAGVTYNKAVNWAVSNGITNGTDTAQTQFSPNKVCNRGTIATFLYRAYVPEARLK